MPTDATYYITRADDGTDIYNCLYCQKQGSEHHASDSALFLQHLEQRHDGRLIEGQPPPEASLQRAPADHPHGGPPGQTGDHPVHPHGGPPGQTGEPPAPDPTPHPEHPLVLPDEEATPEEGV